MHAAVIHLRLSVTPSAAVLQHNLSASDYQLRLDRISTFLHPSSRLQSFNSPTSTLRFHTWTKSFNADAECRMFLSDVSVRKTSRYQDVKEHNLTDPRRKTCKVNYNSATSSNWLSGNWKPGYLFQYSDWATCLVEEKPWFNYFQRLRFSTTFRPALWSIQPLVQCVLRSIFPMDGAVGA
jgi:hypothetical protein